MSLKRYLLLQEHAVTSSSSVTLILQCESSTHSVHEHTDLCVCAVGPSVPVPCTSRGSGGAPGGQAVCIWQCDVHAGPLGEAPRPQAATHCLCLHRPCARLCSGHLHSGNRWFHDADHPASRGNKALLHVTNCSLGLSFDWFQCRKETWINWLVCEKQLVLLLVISYYRRKQKQLSFHITSIIEYLYLV